MKKINKKHVIAYCFIGMFSCMFIACKSTKPVVSAQPKDVKSEQKISIREERQQRMVDALFIDAVKEIAIENYPQAINLLKQVVSLDPNHSAAFYEMAKLLAQQHYFNEALTFAEKAHKLDKNNEWYALVLADLYNMTRNYAKSATLLEELAKKHPENIEYAYAWANTYLYANQPKKAIGVYEWMKKEYGVLEDISMQLYKIYVSTGNINAANKEMETLTLTYPREPQYFKMLAENYMMQKKYPLAKKYYDSAYMLNPNDPYIHLSYASYYRKTGEIDRSLKELDSALTNTNLDYGMKLQSVTLYFTEDSVFFETYKEQALQMLTSITKQYPSEAGGFVILGQYYQEVKNEKEAVLAWRKALSIDSSSFEVWQQLLITEITLNDSTGIIKDGTRALELFPEQPSLYYLTAAGYDLIKDYQKSIQLLKQALPMVVYNDELKAMILLSLAINYDEVGEYALSDYSYEELLRIDPDHAMALNNYAYNLAVRKKRLDEAEKMAKHALSLDPKSTYFLDTYGWVLYQQGKYIEAEKYLAKAIDPAVVGQASISMENYEHYGDVLWKLGQYEKALNYWKKAETLCKGNCPALLEKKIKEKKLIETE